MRNKNLLLAILINLAILVCCITPCIVADNLTNNISDRLDEMPFYNAAIHEHQPLQFDHKFLREDFNRTKIIREQHLTPEHKLKKLSVSEKGASKSNYTFSLHGNVKLLWSYVNDKKDAEVEFDTLDDVNGDGIDDILLSDCNAENKLLVMSGKDGSVIWSKNYPTKIEIEELDDVNEDGVEEAIVFWDEYDSISNQTTIIIELLSGSNGEKIRSTKISYEGEYLVWVHGTFIDISGDGTEDILIESHSHNWEEAFTVLHALKGKDFSTLWKRTFNGYARGAYCARVDLTCDGINDFVVSSCRDDNTGELYVIKGLDGYAEWNKSFIGEVAETRQVTDIDRDGLNDIKIENNDFENKTGEYFVLKGTDGSVIWSKSFNYRVYMIVYFSDLNGDGIKEQFLRLENFTTGRIEEVQVLSGIDGSLIWKKSVNISQVGHSNDLNRDGKDDILFSNSTEIEKNKYLYDVIAISGVDGSVIWKSSFSHDVKIEIPESEHLYEWSYPSGWNDLNGDGITDPLLDVGCWCWCAYRECDTGKLILINGKDGSEIWDVECTADDDILLSTRTWIDFNNDGIKDVLLGTGKGVYLLATTETSINQLPIASFTYSPPYPTINQTITFDASTSYDLGGNIINYKWDFGDRNITNTTEEIITYSYLLAGDYTVNLTVTDKEWAKSSIAKKIVVGGEFPNVIYVPDDYVKIQWAVDNASVGDTIIVKDGTYTENINVNKRLTIKSENGADTTIVQAKIDDTAFEVTADNVNISGFKVIGGISLRSVDYCCISNNNCSKNGYGIGIHLNDSNKNILLENYCSNVWSGIALENSKDNKVVGNTLIGTGIYIFGSSLSDYVHEIDESNTVNGKPIYYWKDVNGGRIPGGAGQVILVNCKNIIVENLILNNVHRGVQIAYSSFIAIKNNCCSSNKDSGIYLWHSNNNSIASNVCSKNTVCGIHLLYSNKNSIVNNNFLNNKIIYLGWGIALWHSNNNSIASNNCINNSLSGIYIGCSYDNSIARNNCCYNERGIVLYDSNENHISNNICSNNRNGINLRDSNKNTLHLNNFISNTNIAESFNSTNTWNSPSKMTYNYNGKKYENYLGNYWDDYEGTDSDGDGIGDIPYSIDGDKDNYPLMERFENYRVEEAVP